MEKQARMYKMCTSALCLHKQIKAYLRSIRQRSGSVGRPQCRCRRCHCTRSSTHCTPSLQRLRHPTHLAVQQLARVERRVQRVAYTGHDDLSIEVIRVLRPTSRGEMHEGLARGEHHGYVIFCEQQVPSGHGVQVGAGAGLLCSVEGLLVGVERARKQRFLPLLQTGFSLAAPQPDHLGWGKIKIYDQTCKCVTLPKQLRCCNDDTHIARQSEITNLPQSATSRNQRRSPRSDPWRPGRLRSRTGALCPACYLAC